MKPRVGRNSPCPCGSGQKYKKCCQPKQTKKVVRTIPLDAIRKFRQQAEDHERNERERVAHFGEVRPQIAIEHQGFRFVAVGSRLCRSKNWRFFPDFLVDYLASLMGDDWRKVELLKPTSQRHQIIQWWTAFSELTKKQRRNEGGFFEAILNGRASAFITLAYDLYTVEHNGRLDEDLLRRPRHPEQFQGARYEIFSEATCLRGGFQIEHENEKDPSTKHAEFIAIHKKTGQRLAIEAKSKHRPGVLGRPGEPETAKDYNLRFGSLLNEAIGKTDNDPLVIFLDTNLPPQVADQSVYNAAPPYSDVPFKLIKSHVDRIRNEHGGIDPYNGIMFTNLPHHYGRDEEPDPRKHFLGIISQIPRNPLSQLCVEAIVGAVNLYGRIPNEFPSN